MSERKWEEELVGRLTELANPDSPNRGVLAHLRQGLDRPLDYTLGRVGWLFSRVPESQDDLLLRNAVLAAGLFAWVKGVCRLAQGINFGAAFGAGLNQEQKQQREKRFIDLLDTDADELPYKLRQAITLIARGEEARLDWALFIWHLVRWEHPERLVQKEWARQFWAATVTSVPQEQSVSEQL